MWGTKVKRFFSENLLDTCRSPGYMLALDEKCVSTSVAMRECGRERDKFPCDRIIEWPVIRVEGFKLWPSSTTHRETRSSTSDGKWSVMMVGVSINANNRLAFTTHGQRAPELSVASRMRGCSGIPRNDETIA
jgi:hypothetical protein